MVVVVVVVVVVAAAAAAVVVVAAAVVVVVLTFSLLLTDTADQGKKVETKPNCLKWTILFPAYTWQHLNIHFTKNFTNKCITCPGFACSSAVQERQTYQRTDCLFIGRYPLTIIVTMTRRCWTRLKSDFDQYWHHSVQRSHWVPVSFQASFMLSGLLRWKRERNRASSFEKSRRGAGLSGKRGEKSDYSRLTGWTIDVPSD